MAAESVSRAGTIESALWKEAMVRVSALLLLTGIKLNIPQAQNTYIMRQSIVQCLKGCLLFKIV
jgi:hypothetical protein